MVGKCPQVTRFTFPDDSKFANITGGLTNGLVFRRVDGDTRNVFNVKTNGDIANICYDLAYADQGKNGLNGVRARISFAGQDKHGVALRLAPGDALQFLVQDDLTSIDIFRIVAQGHIVTD